MKMKPPVALLAVTLAGLSLRAVLAGPIAQEQAVAALQSGGSAFDGGGFQLAAAPSVSAAPGRAAEPRGAFYAEEAPSRGLRAMPAAPPSPQGRDTGAYNAEEEEEGKKKPPPPTDENALAGAVVGGIAGAALGFLMGGPIGAVVGFLAGTFLGAAGGKALGGGFGSGG